MRVQTIRGASVAGLSAAQILGIAEEDAAAAYRDLSPYDVRLVRKDDGWHVDYELRMATAGGSPHYIIHAHTGEILWKRYEQ